MEWGPKTAARLTLRGDPSGRYRVSGLAPYMTADVAMGPAGDGAPALGLALTPVVAPAGPFALDGLLAARFYVCPDGLEDELVAFERETQSRYYNFMAPVGWRYGGLCRVASSLQEVNQPFAEFYSIDATDQAEAEALDAQTKPEPPEILEMYAACARFVIKGLGRWVWLAPGV